MMHFGKSKRGKTAAVLGAGPAGMFTAHGLVRRGYDVTIFSKNRRSEMFGAQYLHAPIPGLDGADAPIDIQYTLIGTPEEYKHKVYGERSVGYVSPEKLLGQHRAWDIRRAYYDAWTSYSGLIKDTTIDYDWLADEVGRYDLMVSTIPATSLCYQGHYFASQDIWAIGDAPERGIFAPVLVANNSVVCDGTKERGWYRASNVFGYKTAEWPEGSKPPVSDVARVAKPIGTNCDCWAEAGVRRAGRYGEWNKGALSHSGYMMAVTKW